MSVGSPTDASAVESPTGGSYRAAAPVTSQTPLGIVTPSP